MEGKTIKEIVMSCKYLFKKYRKRPALVDAVQLTDQNIQEIGRHFKMDVITLKYPNRTQRILRVPLK